MSLTTLQEYTRMLAKPPTTTVKLLSDELSIEVVYDIFLGTIIRVIHESSLIKGIKALNAQTGLTQWFTWFELLNIISYVHRED
jgi:hypothetical protein